MSIRWRSGFWRGWGYVLFLACRPKYFPVYRFRSQNNAHDSIEDRRNVVITILNQCGYRLLGEYKNNHDKIKVACPHGHIQYRSFSAIKHYGLYCAECKKQSDNRSYGHMSKTDRYLLVKKVCQKYNCTLITTQDEYQNCRQLIKIKCGECNRVMQTTFTSFQSKIMGCIFCKKRLAKNTNGVNAYTYFQKQIVPYITAQGYHVLTDEYANSRALISMTCPNGHEIKMRWGNFKFGKRCRICSLDAAGKRSRNAVNEVSSYLASNGYEILSEYESAKKHIKYRCPNGHLGSMSYSNFHKGHRCPKCSGSNPKWEIDLYKLIKSWGIDVDRKNREYGLEIDLYCSKQRVGIELHGIFFHSTRRRVDAASLHRRKFLQAIAHNVRLLQFFEDEWLHKQPIIISMIKSALGLSSKKIYARNCTVKPISGACARKFFDASHIDGFMPASIYYGAYYNDELVQAISIMRRAKYAEIIRFASALDTQVVGGFQKLLAALRLDMPIKTYSNCRFGSGNVYRLAGFKYIKHTKPGYWYVVGRQRVHRLKYRCLNGKSERERSRGLYRIYDAGHYSWEKEK